MATNESNQLKIEELAADRRVYYLRCRLKCLEAKAISADPFNGEFEDIMRRVFETQDEIKGAALDALRARYNAAVQDIYGG